MASLDYGIIGIGGYGAAHLAAVHSLETEGLVRLQAVTEAFPHRCREALEELVSRGVRVYDDYREMLRAEKRLDIVSIATPLHLHMPMALACFERRLHVMLEKPPAVLVQHVDRMLEAAAARGCLCQVGFQSIADGAAVELKAKLSAGEIGCLREIVVRGFWRRTDGYYERADWAGRLRLGNEWVLDGPMNNPLSHYIHEALFLACPRERETARPLSVRAELYRAHPIEGEDIVCARAELEGGTTMCTYLTVCAPEHHPATIEIVGEKGTAFWTPGRYEVAGPGGCANGSASNEGAITLVRNLVRAVLDGTELQCPLSATRNVILHNNGCFKSCGLIRPVPADLVRRYRSEREGEAGQIATEVEGLMAIMEGCAQERRLFSEAGIEWAAQTPTALLDFDTFDPTPLLG